MAIDRERLMTTSTLFRRATGAVFAASLAMITAPAHADDMRIDDAWKAALSETDGILDDQQMAIVNVIAYSSAAALLCDGIDIDADKVATATTAVLADTPPDLTDDEQLARFTAITLMMGTAKGIILAEGALHKDKFCAAAVAEKADAKTATFWK
jgi:hypothetical protein